MEGTILRFLETRRTQRLVKPSAYRGAAAPLFERRVGPADFQVEIDQCDAVGQGGQDALGAKQVAEAFTDQRIGRIGKDGIERLALELIERFRQRLSADDFPFRVAATLPIGAGVAQE